jgi:thiol-disulfide isomerase/thioredoxin
MRWGLAALLVALSVAVSLAPAQDKKATATKSASPDDRQSQLDQMIQDFVKARQEASAALRAAKTSEDEKAAREKLPREADFLPRVHKLIVGAPKDEVAAEALAFAVFGLQTKDEKVFDALAKDYVKTDQIRRFVQMAMSGAPDAAKPVLEKVLVENSSKELRGMASYALGAMAFEKEGPAAAKEAEKYFARVEKEFADVPAGRKGTLGAMARGSLFELRNLQVGMKAPPAESKDLKGEKVSLADYQGKVVVLDIWATWCGPCKAMIPHEREMVEKLKGKPFALISVSADEDKKELEEFIAKEPMPWAHWWEGADAPLLKQWNIRFFPTIYVIDDKGVIRHKNIRGEELEKAVEKLVAEVKP